ncbi:MAG: amino acid adenylation domain-containing protein [Candidatus Hinthialibacter antarcticus]|nr:amino acid adenylation domain-containing protein [Candidatus Hinthialibacter antarcticus]
MTNLQKFPLSFHQERMWFIDRFETNNVYETHPVYHNIPLVLYLRGAVDAPRLETSLSKIVQRHASLRIRVSAQDEQQTQWIDDDCSISVPVVGPDETAALDWRTWAQQETLRPFDLNQERLLRATLLRIAPDESVLVMVAHHIIADRTSMGLLTNELKEIYQALSENREPNLPPVDVQYPEYAQWQKSLRRDDFEPLLFHWRWELRGRLQALELPEDKPRPAVHTYTARSIEFSVDAELTRGILAGCRQHETPPSVWMLAAYVVLLHRYSRLGEIVVGTPFDCRRQDGLAGGVGPYSNLTVLRSRMEDETTLQELLNDLHKRYNRAAAFQEMPFDLLVKELNPQKDMSRTALFDVLYQYDDAASAFSMNGLDARVIETNLGFGKYDLNLLCKLDGDQFAGVLTFNLDIYDDATARRMAAHYESVLRAMAQGLSGRVCDAPLLSEGEVHQQCVEWNHTEAAYPDRVTVHELFEAQARQVPDKVAVIASDRTLTYRELDRAANQLAHELRRLGVKEETLVAVCLDRSADAIVALLAVMKAGGAYLPIDPAFPEERLRFTVEDAAAEFLISTQALADAVPVVIANTVLLDRDAERIAAQPTDAPENHSRPEHLIYCLYTSGSTGRPKGVLIEHRNVVRLLFNDKTPFDFSSEDVWTMFHSYTFDFSVWELYGALLYGGAVVMVSKECAQDPATFLALLREHRVTVLNQTPSAFDALTGAARQAGLPELDVRYVIFGGEALNPKQLSPWREAYPDARLINMYGITETTVHVTYKEMTDGDLQQTASAVGRPIATTTTYVMDERLRLAPIGVAGELCVGGLGVGRGYLNRDELTREKFIENPYRNGERLYRSGDLVKQRPDGELVYLGRIDDQVQIRGFRVEMGEARARLLEHPAVREAEVVAIQDDSGATALAAYFTATQAIDLSELRAHIVETLPDYMAPSYYVLLPRMPLTPNGKLDRKALPDPLEHRIGSEAPYAAPRTPRERVLVSIWAETLELERAGIHDNFFELGGHSILATQLASRIRERFDFELPLRRIFEAPTPAQLAAYLPEPVAGAAPEIQPAQRSGSAPLSYSQQRLWLLNQLEGQSATYNVIAALELRGRLDVDALQKSLDAVVARHEALRTVIRVKDRAPIQIVMEPIQAPIRRMNLRNLNDASRQAAIDQAVNEESKRTFDLENDVLLRTLLIDAGDQRAVFVITLHHIITDGWSQSILVHDLAKAYQAYRLERGPDWAPLPLQYADYAIWQRQWIQSDAAQSQFDFWKETMRGAPALLELPTDRPRPPVQRFTGRLKTFQFDGDLLQRLKQFSNEQGATLFMTLHAAFVALLSRYSGQTDIVLGTGVANRNRRELEPLVGFFVNTLLLRVDASERPTFIELLQRTQAADLAAYEHQDAPFERLVDVLQPERELGYTPLFQVMFTLQNTPDAKLTLPDLDITPRRVDAGASKFDLTVLLNESGNGLEGVVEYSDDLFDDSSIERLFGHYEIFLRAALKKPNASVAELPLIGEAEMQQHTAWNQTAREYQKEQSIIARFTEIAARLPNALAVEYGETRLTYQELDQRSNQLAHTLIQKGVKPGGAVGLMQTRSAEFIISLLAILKAGAAYAPLDPSYPDERLAFMAQDCGASILITEDAFKTRLPNFNGELILSNIGWTLVSGEATAAPDVHRSADDLAYIIYTSGSTGTPKGVMVSHRGVMRLVLNNDYCPLDASDRIAQAANASFDAATFEIWGALLNGAALIGVDRDVTLAPLRFAQALQEKKITTLFITTALFNEMARQAPKAFAGLRHVLFGGEAVDSHWVGRVLREGAPDRLLHVYGPTENTTFSTWHRVWNVDDDAHTVPIGQAVANSQAYVVDANGQLAPAGVPGELWVGGDGLALGYLNQPELTAKTFIDNPFGPERSPKLYRTGDIVKRRADGAIEFIGRIDDQVKIRGFRIEPGEIEARLTQHARVDDAVVLYRDGRLIGYVVAKKDNVNPVELSAFLKGHLPDYMVPQFYVFLDALPINENGKVDRKRLPEPDLTLQADESAAPQTPLQELLAGVWQTVLRIEGVGVHDNFFQIGGHSLSATQVVSRIRESLGVELPLRDLFQSPTIAGLAERIERQQKQTPPEPPIVARRQMDEKLPLSYAQERLWFLDKIDPGNPFYNVSIALNLNGALNAAALHNSLNSIVARHGVLRARFGEDGGAPYQTIEAPFDLELPVRSLDEVSPEQVEDEIQRLTIEEARRPFDLSRDRLIRASLLRVDESRHVLFLTMHHIVSDGWSLGVLIEELAPLYRSDCEGAPASLAPLRIQYADYAVWQREWLSGDVLEQQTQYWTQQLVDAPPVLNLPTDRPRPPAQSYRGDSVTFEIPAEVAKKLRGLCRANDATLFMTLLSAYAALLHRYSGQDDIVIGSPIANRTRSEIESLVGFFVNTLALRFDFSQPQSFETLLRRARNVTLDAYTHQDLPFEKLVDELQLERDLSVNPLFQVMFSMQNAPMQDLSIPGLDISLVATRRVAALFDMVLDVWETGDSLTGVLEFNTDIFDESTIQRFVGHYQRLLERIVDAPEAPVGAIDILSSQEKTQLLDEWAGPVREYPVEQTIHQLFERSAAAAPQRAAVVHNENSLTYEELNQRANRIAHRLRRQGVKPNDFVGILEPRGNDCLAAMLGVLKAGGAFMPIDPVYPDERVRYMIANSEIKTLITRSSLSSRFDLHSNENHLAHIIQLDADDLSSESDENPSCVNSSRDAAYLLYTSGSTGQPKGAIVRHDGAVNHIFAEFDWLEFHQDSAFLQSAPSSSDISVWQFLAPGLIGGRTVIADFETVCDPTKLFELIQSQRITLIELVPVVMKELLEHVRPMSAKQRALPYLQFAMATGESVPVALVNHWLETYPGVPVVNAYGPTEAADDICQYTLTKPLPSDARSVPIGYALANLRLYVLDQNLQLVPVGVAGEICVAGIGVGAGYFNNQEKTGAVFVKNPYAKHEHEAVLYRTGDLGYWRPDGVLECMERLDFQVKIRGFRIELGEIESVLGRHPSVRETAVIVRDDPGDEKRLVGYATLNLDASETQKQLRDLKNEQVELWQTLHEDSYVDSLTYQDETFNVIGWDSNYTNAPLPEADMREYVGLTVERILSLRPKRVIEIGCGTGLIMFPLLPHLQGYIGSDLSQVSIGQLQALQARADLQDKISGLAQAILEQREATDFSRIEPGAYDVAILPSVVQYFPGVDYLLHVLEGLMKTLAAGGSIFVGDVRSLPLLQAFHASVQLYKAEDGMSVDELAERVRRQFQQEQEMAIGPDFFIALQEKYEAVSHVEIMPKRGTQRNEMTRFRYDVVIHLEKELPLRSDFDWRAWDADAHSLDGLRRLLEPQPDALALRDVVNPRVEQEFLLMDCLEKETTLTVQELRTRLKNTVMRGVDPDDLLSLATSCGYALHTSFARNAGQGRYDAALVRGDAQPVFVDEYDAKPWREYANNPLQEKLHRRLTSQLREFIKDKLPNYMAPSDFVFLSDMPLSPAGKIDRKALPQPEAGQSRGADDYVAPVTDAEKQMGKIWAEVLGAERVGLNDNFFELGGHSLKATQVVSRIQRDMNAETSLRALFNHPTIAELLETMEAAPRAAYVEIARAADADSYPLSHGQRRLWILSQMEGASAAYNMPAALLIDGEVDREGFTAAFADLVQRHESLRTAFVMIGGEPRQQIVRSSENALQWIDLSREPAPLQAARELALQDAQREFDLSSGALLRGALLRLNEAQHVLLFNMHHIISDDLSMDVLAQEFMALYQARRDGAAANLPELRIQYRDFAQWQNDFLDSDEGRAQRDYWRETLSGDLPVLQLPTDFARPAVKTYHGASAAYSISQKDAEAIDALCQQMNCSAFMFFSAMVNVLLHRTSGQEDIVTGFPVSGRNHPDLEGQIGFYVNTLPLRVSLDGETPFRELLRVTALRISDALDRQAYPFDRLVDELSLQRDVSRSPLFDVVTVMQGDDGQSLTLDGATLRPLVEDYPMAKFDLAFNFQKTRDGVSADIVFNTDLFSPETAERMGACLHELIRAALKSPSLPIGKLNWLTDAEREINITRYDAQPASQPLRFSTLAAWFEHQAAQTPNAVAVSCQDDGQRSEWTYRELNQRANQLAHDLRARGVRPNDLVGVYLPRGAELIAALLAVIKSGGAYLPLDGFYPKERLAFMLDDAQVKAVITLASIAHELPQHAAQMVALDGDAQRIGQCSDENPASVNRENDTAYVIYTSGSTGRPKGVMVSHRNVLRLFQQTETWFGFGADDVWSYFHSCAFDFSVWELWGALLYGGRLAIVPYELSREPEAFYDFVAREKITALNQTPSAFRQFIQAEERAAAPAELALRTVIFGGEALDFAMLKPWFERHDDNAPQLVNMFGITETTVHVTYRPIRKTDAAQSASLIGEPIDDLQIYIFDANQQPVPIGVFGELYVGGAGVAKGYLNREDLTAERFIQNPFSNKSDERLYRTGDRGRFLANGDIEYGGRIDQQVQVRGFRVELGEIESALQAHEAVREAVVIAEAGEFGDRLLAYCIPNGGLPDAGALRAFLATRLPEYMAPSAFMALERFPLTPNGKLDAKALPRQSEDRPELSAAFVAPRNEIEQTIAKVFETILKIDGVGVQDNFFDLGANSMSLVQACHQLRERLSCELSVVQLFQFTTIEALARMIAQDAPGQEAASVSKAQERAAKRSQARQRRNPGRKS